MPIALVKSRLLSNPQALSLVGGLRRPDPRLLSTYVRIPLRVGRIFRVLWKPRRKSSIQGGGGKKGKHRSCFTCGCASSLQGILKPLAIDRPFRLLEKKPNGAPKNREGVISWDGLTVLSLRIATIAW
jgi:hypothetical protein